MKFDLIISNPPYNRNLDLKILNDIYNVGEKICFIHPGGWLYDNKYISALYTGTKRKLENAFSYYEVVNNANKLFNIFLFTDVFITHFNKNSKSNINIHNVDIHGDSETYINIKHKILKYCKKHNLSKKLNCDKCNKNMWYTGFSGIRGNSTRNDFHSFIQLRNEDLHIGHDIKYHLKYMFDTEQEAVCFKDYLKTKIVRFCLSIYKINQHLETGELTAVPYMPTYAHKWTDEDVAKELGLTDEELKWAINWIPDYYLEDKEKYKKYK